MKKIGILLPLFSLPNDYGIGSMGKEAYQFIDFLAESHIAFWQLLPLGITSFGDSPYQSLSSMAGGINYIDLEALFVDGLITKEELEENKIISNHVEYGKLFETRLNLLKKAHQRFLLHDQEEYLTFKKNNRDWLDDFSLYMALKAKLNFQPLNLWDKDYQDKESEKCILFKKEYANNIDVHAFGQFLFFKQWYQLKQYANKKHIKIIGDMPIYVSPDSADVFGNHNVFLLDERKNPTLRAGVPPDYFSEDGQLWGNPIYNYDYLRKTKYQWMLNRFKHYLSMFDIIRLDHFRGYASYYVVDQDSTTAKNGHWEDGPRMELFSKVKKMIHQKLSKRMIAEDLGVLTDDVEKLLKDTHLGGMKVMQFGYPDVSSTNYYKNYRKNQVVYPGTHDNDTILGWYNNQDEILQNFVLKDLNTTEKNLVEDFLKAIINSKAKIIIIPFADLLKMNSEGRINTPGLTSGNWQFRISQDDLSKSIIKEIIKY